MARPLRIEFSGALYHVTSRGDGQEAISQDDADRHLFIDTLDKVCTRFDWVMHAYCLMGNHYHLLVETPNANLAKGMRQLNGVYTQAFNKTHHRVGHVFQGRYKAILVQKESYLLELARYIVLNPVRAGMVSEEKDWPWSSYAATVGQVKRMKWLQTEWILAAFSHQKGPAIDHYRAFVAEGHRQPGPWEQLKNQLYLGSNDFVDEMQMQQLDTGKDLREIPARQRRAPASPLVHYATTVPERDAAIRAAYASGGYTMNEIGGHFGLHYSYISRIISRADKAQRKT